ncbi:MAG: DNA alkylation repair protein [Ruminococcaceae bacterium]|nr:DNA alkylation repair protein [Oscillospiraceae bacterium]
MVDITEKLFSMQDKAYRDFNSKLVPNVKYESIIGVRIPLIRKTAKEISDEDAKVFLSSLPHGYFEEYHLHAFLIGKINDFDICIEEAERFLPYIDNWSVCDSFSPKVFKKHKGELLDKINVWLESTHTYTVRFAIKMLMEHFLDEDFRPEYPEKVASVKSDEYYVKMMAAWYFATALAKQYDAILPYLESCALDSEIHKMTVRKILDSYRISNEQKNYIRTFGQPK